MRPNTDGILESSLYVSDVARSTRFYQETFGFPVISEFGERGLAMHPGRRQVLLLFKNRASRAIQSPHNGDKELHVAFAIPAAELSKREAWLQARGIAVEEKRAWESGHRLQTVFEDMSPEMLMNGFLRNQFETPIHSSS